MESNGILNTSQSESEYGKIVKKIKTIEEALDESDFEQNNIYIDISGILENKKNEQKLTSYMDIVSYIERELENTHSKRTFFNTAERQTKTQQYTDINSKIKNMHINIKELVLPTLSIADQVSELERISRAINEGVLDNNHMKIVIEEVYGLKLVLDKNDKSAKGMIGINNSIESLRSQRLSDVMSKIE